MTELEKVLACASKSCYVSKTGTGLIWHKSSYKIFGVSLRIQSVFKYRTFFQQVMVKVAEQQVMLMEDSVLVL